MQIRAWLCRNFSLLCSTLSAILRIFSNSVSRIAYSIPRGVSDLRRQHRSAAQADDCSMNERAIRLGEYIAEHGATVRSTAQVFGISKSTVHKDISTRLPSVQPGLYEEVRVIIEKNKQERHIRGGMATRRKYEKQRIRTQRP